MSYLRIRNMHLAGKITAQEAAMLLELNREIDRLRRRQEFWRDVYNVVTLGPVRRWIGRMR